MSKSSRVFPVYPICSNSIGQSKSHEKTQTQKAGEVFLPPQLEKLHSHMSKVMGTEIGGDFKFITGVSLNTNMN